MNQIGHKIIHLDVVDSTNNYVANLAKEDRIEHGTVILADEQTNGRGQRGTIWQTQPGLNLVFSLYMEFSAFPIEKQSSIHHWISLSLLAVLKKTGVFAEIKWPNDLLTENGKIAGILIENSLSDKYVKYSIVGVGLNVNQFDFQDLKATSIRLETGVISNVKEIAFMLVNELSSRFDRLMKSDFEALRKEYHEKLWGINREVRFLRNGNDVEERGVILGTNEIGALGMKTERGLEYFDLKEVKFMIDNSQ